MCYKMHACQRVTLTSRSLLDYTLQPLQAESVMIYIREILEDLEDKQLAPYGFRSRDSKGREYPDPEREYRTAFQRDRDRIVHTTAFRRLEYKTQVFVITEGDYYRTRLTHTLEVAQIGRTIARALGANEDLVEAICLAHDLGHTPFGHSGEHTLSELMSDHGGFEHNRQSLRIVTTLEQRFPQFSGLNLTYEVREGMVKHETEYDISDAEGYDPGKRGNLEAQITNVADETAYTAHDLDDGLRSGLLKNEQLQGLTLLQKLRESIGWDTVELNDTTRHQLIRRLIDMQISDVLGSTSLALEASGAQSVCELQRLPNNVVAHSEPFIKMNRELKDFLFENMYRHFRVYRMQIKAEHILQDLFNAYAENPGILPAEVQERAKNGEFHRVMCDYIAGMTDRFALDEHSRIFNPQVAF
ncbi:MAG TPA: deoxyguanosinetriphosphate triphosphohydrolase [Anaerolineales bacterium]|nr:deoxyguanosinetriphosphate triphosphohydrolase [Anaerolineales bacterium]